MLYNIVLTHPLLLLDTSLLLLFAGPSDVGGAGGNPLKILAGIKGKHFPSKGLGSLFVPQIFRPSYGPGLLYTAPTTKNDDDAGQMLMVQELKRAIQKIRQMTM